MNKQNVKKYTVKRTVAWFLVICIVLASFTGIDVYAADSGEETYSVLRVKEWLRYDDNGKLIMDGNQPGDMDKDGNIGAIGDTVYKEVQLPGETLWIDLVTFKGDGTFNDNEDIEEGEETDRQHISMNNSITVDYCETIPFNDTVKNVNDVIKLNENDSRLIDFTPKYIGYYMLSYGDYSLLLDVRYPEAAFYKEADLSLDNLIHNGYDDGTISYYHGQTENSVYFYLYNIAPSNEDVYKREITLAGCEEEDEEKATFVLSYWDDNEQHDCKKYGGNSGIEDYFIVDKVSGKDGWYKITFAEELKGDENASINSFYLRVNAKGTVTWQEDEEIKTDSYNISFGLGAECYSPGLYAINFGSQDGFYTESSGNLNPIHNIIRLKNVSVDADGEAKEIFLTDISEIKVHIWEENEDGSGQWSEEPVNNEYVEYKICEDNPGYFDFLFYKEGRYGITNGNGSFVTIHAWLPAFGFYKEPERPDGGGKIETLLADYNILEGQTDSFYMVTWFDNMNPDCPDMETFKINAYDESDKDVFKYIDYSKEIRDKETGALIGYEVKILKEATGHFKLVASGKTVSSYYVEDGEGNKTETKVTPYEIDNTIWIKCIPLLEIKITTLPLKTVYTEGEQFEPAGMKVTAVYENGAEKEISSEEYRLNITDILSTANKDVTITYQGKTAKFNLVVNAKETPSPSATASTGPSVNLGFAVIPGPIASPSPSASQNQAVSPSPTASQSQTVSPSPSASQSPVASLNPEEATITPDITAKPGVAITPDITAKPGAAVTPDTQAKPGVSIKAGDSARDSKTGVYKITKIASDGTPVIVYIPNKTAKKAKDLVIKSTVKINGKNYKVTKIADNALSGNKNLKKVTIPDSITVIGKNAFKDCQKLKSIVIPSNIKKICSSAFKGCSSLKKVTIKSSKIKSIGKNSFKNLANGVVIKIPKAKKTVYKEMLKKTGYTGTIKF